MSWIKFEGVLLALVKVALCSELVLFCVEGREARLAQINVSISYQHWELEIYFSPLSGASGSMSVSSMLSQSRYCIYRSSQ